MNHMDKKKAQLSIMQNSSSYNEANKGNFAKDSIKETKIDFVWNSDQAFEKVFVLQS